MFKVVEIIGGNLIKVSPLWLLKQNGSDYKGDLVQISGLNTVPNEYLKHRLNALLLSRDVELINPSLIEYNDGNIVSCNALIDKTDITYYFPELKKPQVLG